ncbi:hypothetical protein PI95_003970 [Hassallia byssoidea VB512170]|uniref:Uncharacterized protein n=1 Tax=Hassallia byssoidea VB512170 TaxID=1304833 RepID=A0A846H584_9CYAN|nr:hypothetical protein [Hassalia byssoidea]NEU71760.1 hypothetical protein [Hassalia byssoidea VB512170]
MNALIEAAREEKVSLAMIAYIAREAIKELNISKENFESARRNPPTAEEQRDAAKNFTIFSKEISEQVQELDKLALGELKDDQLHNQQPEKLIEQNSTTFDDEKKYDNSNNNGEKLKEESKKVAVINAVNVQQFVIPVIVQRLAQLGRADKENIVYEGQDYTASLRLEKDYQTLSLDRNSPTNEEAREALLASKNSNEQEYSIVINNLTQEEFERFKVLFKEEQVRKEEKQQAEFPVQIKSNYEIES